MIYRPELCTEEKLLSYAKYYYIDPDPLNPVSYTHLDVYKRQLLGCEKYIERFL